MFKYIFAIFITVLFNSNAVATEVDLSQIFDHSQAKQIKNDDCWHLYKNKDQYISVKLAVKERIFYRFRVQDRNIKPIKHNDKIIVLQCGDWAWSKAYAYSLTEEQFIEKVIKISEQNQQLQQAQQRSKNIQLNSILNSIEK